MLNYFFGKNHREPDLFFIAILHISLERYYKDGTQVALYDSYYHGNNIEAIDEKKHIIDWIFEN